MKNWFKKTEYENEWKKSLIIVITNVKKKFVKYYEKIENVKEEFYAIAVILNSYVWINVYNSEH